jgi:hypothetical protein
MIRESPTKRASVSQAPAHRGYQRARSTAAANAVVVCPDGNEPYAYSAGKQGKLVKNAPASGAFGLARQRTFFKI